MSLTDERKCGAEAVGGKRCLPAGHNMGRLDIPSNHQAEATKPALQELDEPFATILHENLFDLCEGEATKPQEPVSYQELFDAIAAATSVACFPGINISIKDFTAKIGPLYTTPQPCPKCVALKELFTVDKDGRTMADQYLDVKAKYAELQVEFTVFHNIAHDRFAKQSERIKELEAELQFLRPGKVAIVQQAEHISQLEAVVIQAGVEASELEAERDALKDENVRLEKQACDYYFKITTLIQERDALAMIAQQMREALESIQRYGFDTLSGRVDGPDDRAWQRAGVNEMTKRAQSALALPDTSEIIKRHDAELIAAIRSVPCSNCGMVSKAVELEKSCLK